MSLWWHCMRAQKVMKSAARPRSVKWHRHESAVNSFGAAEVLPGSSALPRTTSFGDLLRRAGVEACIQDSTTLRGLTTAFRLPSCASALLLQFFCASRHRSFGASAPLLLRCTRCPYALLLWKNGRMGCMHIYHVAFSDASLSFRLRRSFSEGVALRGKNLALSLASLVWN